MRSTPLRQAILSGSQFFSLLFLFHFSLFAQSSVKGTIKSSDGIPLPGTSILIKSTNKSAIADGEGRFSIQASPGDKFEFTFVGYRKYELQLGNQTELNITLTEKIMSLEQVVYIGYGNTRRKDVTGAVASISADQFNTGVITNPMQEIQGKVAGVVIVQPGGDPNGDFLVRVRGATSLEGQPPLLVIDGIAIDDFNRALSTLNPADVESYDILKDASAAAIYGARGANGVILVTTKAARAGKTSVEYNGYVGIEQVAHQLNMLDASQWRKATGSSGTSIDQGANTDWQKEISQTAFSQSHSVGISGGTDLFKFHGSVGYQDQQGVIRNTGRELVTARINAEQKSLNNKLNIRYTVNTSSIHRDFLPDQSNTQMATSGNGGFVFYQALSYLPVWPVFNSDGSYYQPATNTVNPRFILDEFYSKQRQNFYQGSAKADYEILRGLKIGLLGALTGSNDVYDKFWPAIPGSGGVATAAKSNDNKQVFSGDLHGNYHKNFGKHTIDFTGVYEYNRFVNDGFSVSPSGFLVPELLNNNFAAATSVTTADISSYKNEVKLISFLGRLVYDFDQRYILTANFRRDGSSKFGPNHRWGNFPSVSVAWRISNESFMKDITWIGDLKFRVSYGYTGNQENLPPNKYQLLYAPAGPYLYNGQIYQSYAVNQEYNPDLKWEVRKSFNIGLDFSLFDDRLNGSVDVFNDETSDMLFLYNIPQPPFLTNNVYANAATAVNKGVEITIGAAVIKNRNFSWNIQGNLATLDNHITKLLGQFKGVPLSLSNSGYGTVSGPFGSAYVTQLVVGYPTGVFWLPQHAGLDAGGNELFNNYDASGKLIGTSTTFTDADRRYINPSPKFTWGMTNSFRYKNIDLSFFFRGVQGQKIYSNTLMTVDVSKNLPGANVREPALSNGFTNYPVPSTYWMQNGSFGRLDHLTIGYSFQKIKGISKLRLYFTGTNLFVVTSYQGIDPEVRTEGNYRYIDANYYPKTRGFIFGVNLVF